MPNQVPLIVERQGSVLTISLNNPSKKNALNSEMMGAMTAAIEGSGKYSELRAVVIQGAGSFGVSPQIINLTAGLSANPQSLVVPITIYGPLPLLNTLSPDSVPINLDMSDFSAGIHKIETVIILPPGVRTEPLQPILVSVILSSR